MKLRHNRRALVCSGIAFVLIGAEGIIQLFHHQNALDTLLSILSAFGLVAGYFLLKQYHTLKNEDDSAK
ncbi:hypothetical protein [Salinibacillus xinjiangensis]|uniref:Uncharacterized protein n=1 Tax=Salinibacillus xinjiangensis TaxID=1229268 RepID=A0A6G1X8Y0_9BACI|nr:hypothetical protein [Salinibacillus xinjiangensis]MRG87424.1 hypothetical protein [Salinibacillus xinjiangensis]